MQIHDGATRYRESLTATSLLALWVVGWLATLAVATFGPERLWESNVLTWIAAGANVVAGVGWIAAFMRYLRTLDELDRKITLDALAITLGVGWIGGFAYIVLEQAEQVAYDGVLAFFTALLGVVYMLAFTVGKLRYR